jgi:hypothetical protein
MFADEDLHRHAAENLAQADALLFGRVTYEMMEAAWRAPARTGARPDWMQPWMEPFARTIDAAKKYVVSSTLDRLAVRMVQNTLRRAPARSLSQSLCQGPLGPLLWRRVYLRVGHRLACREPFGEARHH